MRRYILTFALVTLCATIAFAQEQTTSATASARSATSTSANAKAINLESGTQLSGQLQNTLDVRKAKVGDQVVLKTTQAIKANGRTVVNKGARLIGHVSEVSQRSKANGESRLGLVFDRLESGSLETPINATITSVTSAISRARVGDDGFESESSARSSSSARTTSRQSSSSSGGLLSGVGGTVGGVVNTSTQTVGSVVGGTTGAVGETAGGLTKSVGGIRVSQSSDASVDGSSTLSLTGDNLRLEKGTAFNLRLNQATNIDTRNDQ